MQSDSMVTPAQLRAARGMLDWSRNDLSAKSGVPRATIADYEASLTVSMLPGNLVKIVEAFGRQGVIFIDADGVNGSGVRWRKEPRQSGQPEN